MWFEVKVNYEKMAQDGSLKKATEVYLIDALSHAEAEERMAREMQAYVAGEFTVSRVRRINIAEAFFNEDGERFYRARVDFITIDEKTGMTKLKAHAMLVQASSIDEALAALHKEMKGTMADYNVKSISETTVTEVFFMEINR
jgi:hypothetical protein